MPKSWRFEDLSGQKFGKLKVLYRDYSKTRTAFLCECDCGVKKVIGSNELKNQKTLSCGCHKGDLLSKRQSKNLIGKTYGRLYVYERLGIDKYGKQIWRSKCSCGNITDSTTGQLTSGSKKSCGCLKIEKTIERTFKDLTEQRFGKLLVLNKSNQKTNSKRIKWNCLCECGKNIIVMGNQLVTGRTKSCGCIKADLAKEKIKDLTGKKFGLLTVIGLHEKRIWAEKKVGWNCLCECGNEIVTTASALKQRNTKSCGCVKSYGELKIFKILRKNKIKIKQQYTFEELTGVGMGKLKFDFAILKEDNSLSHLIEYDGEQHYDTTSKYYTEELALHDQLKNEFCKKNNIRLIRLRDYKNLTIQDLL